MLHFKRIFIMIATSMLLFQMESGAFPKHEEKMTSEINKLGKRLESKYNIIYLNHHVGSIVDCNKLLLDISLMGYQNMTVDMARLMIMSIYQDFLYEVTHNPVYDFYFKKVAENVKWYDPVFTPGRLGIRITFWDRNIDRYPPPYVSMVKVYLERIEYYLANPTDQFLQAPFIETFEEASKKLKPKMD